jgi:hypothetical protein
LSAACAAEDSMRDALGKLAPESAAIPAYVALSLSCKAI